ncbi:DUF1176 domain-containing protein [Sphingomonas ginsenosidivorax]|uniref:DUF1176 domain-containing protein n=1 Tax=Sphingomonas ginsenosidivorax TaxID=862135 RepID=A0A5C6UIP3_9SPHN|nr:DUF1176 domain-containing protein [Sphingomonas ginsenosidivorax]TXC72106.1 DUF1176 domain-containing protein [Sphingomonas ginsenosidivorax]
MTRFALPLLLSVVSIAGAACSPPSADIAPDPTPAAAPNAVAADNATAPEPAAPSPPPAAVADSKAVPKQGALETFGDWAVGCDNGLRCTLASLLPEAGEADNVTLNIVREGDAETKVYIDSRDEAIRPASLWVDGKKIATKLTPESALAIAEALPAGRRLELRNRKDKAVATISLKGAAAAMRYADAEQGRAGTPTALVAKGTSTKVVEAPVLPTIVAPAITGEAATPTAAQLAAMRKQAECDLVDDQTGVLSPEAHAVGGGKTLVILPCSTGAYNLIGALFVIDGKAVTPAEVDSPSGFDETGADSQTPVRSVVNGAFRDGLLTSYAKGRGIGDCGVQQSYVWDGTTLRLSEQSAMSECRGNPNYISTWRATVVRR